MNVRSAKPGRSGRILMLGHINYPDEVRLRREAEQLAREGYRVTVLALRRPAERLVETVNGVRIYRVPITKQRGSRPRYLGEFLSFFLVACVLVPLLQAWARYRVIQLYNQPDFLIFALLVPRLLGARIVFDYRDAMPETFCVKYGLSMAHPLIRILLLFERAGLMLSDRVVTVHEPFRQQAIRRGARPEKVVVFLNFPDPHLFRREIPPARSRPDSVQLQLMYHGTIADRFGLASALEALVLLKDEIPGLRFTIYGEGDGVPAVERMLASLPLKGVAEYAGRIPLSEIPAHITQADIGIVPVRRDLTQDISLSTKVLEYMIMGKPVIASWRPILEQYLDPASITYYQDGHPEELAERIREFWRDGEKVRRQVAAADAFLARHPWAELSREYLAMIDALAGRTPR